MHRLRSWRLSVQAAVQRLAAGRDWWRRSGEPLVLTLLVLLAGSLPLLVLLGGLSGEQALQLGLGLAGVGGGLLALRLPRLLHNERRRIAVLVGVALVALAGALFGGPLATRAGPADAELAAALHAVEGGAGVRFQAQGDDALTFKAPPRISRQAFAAILQRGVGGGTSPAAPYAGELYDIIVGYGLDPAVALAFFAHESSFCTAGVCQVYDTKNWGAQRAAVRRERVIDVVRVSSGPFVRFRSWQDGVRDWCELILYRYIDRGLDTVEKAVPVYAPASDGNVPASYINAIYRTVGSWQGRAYAPPVSAVARTYNEPLESALLKEMFLAGELEYQAGWAFHQYMLAEAQAGRPLGSPLSPSQRISVGGQQFVVQVFALDTIYTPLAAIESDTNWSDVRRLSHLLSNTPVPATPTVAPTPTVIRIDNAR